MDNAPLVEGPVEDGRALIEQLARSDFDLALAFWVRLRSEEPEERGPWFYIVSKTLDTSGARAGFLAIHDALHRISAPWIAVSAMSELKLVGMSDPLVRDVLALRDRYPGRHRFRGVSIGNQTADELYIYPPISKSLGSTESGSKHRINVGTANEPEVIDLEKVPLVTIIRDTAGPSKVVLVGGGKPQRSLEGEDAQRFIAEFDALTKQME